ncbi:uncharacterized protein LOC143535097 [Bidens hawaiensis]|uniref:uncharacterized protein LOC143535097 n=1 Tax=Bidens hawaiensis TaxID=980011 RepID=UPI0040492ED6
MDTNGGAAPTGCYKCGRPGHWSRDCPSNPNTKPNPNPNSNNNDGASNKPAASSHPFKSGGSSFTASKQPVEKPKKVPKTRPKLTPELLLSDDGIGFVLKHFPKALKVRGRGHEANDLGNLIGLYSEWHKHLMPYYSFDHFVHKVEQVGSSKRVKMCINDLRDKIANGGDPAKILETPELREISNPEQDKGVEQEDALPNHDPDDFQHNMFDEIFEKTTEEPSGPLNKEGTSGDTSAPKEVPRQTTDQNSTELSEEVKARIESNRLKALERAAARKRALESQAS